MKGTRVVKGSAQFKINKLSQIQEIEGKLNLNNVDDKLMHSVMDNDKQTIEDAKLIQDAINYSVSSFSPDIMFEQFVKDFSLAKNIYGESILRCLSGYDPDFIEKNINVPEFQRELKNKIKEKLKDLRGKNLIDRDNIITDKGIELAALVLYTEELDNLVPKGLFGDVLYQKHSIYGSKKDIKDFKKGDHYKDIALRRSIRTAIKRGHNKLDVDDLRVFEREAKGTYYIIYALDASGSMKGKKIATCKKAGIALAYKAIDKRDKVGLIVFGKEVFKKIPPTDDFTMLLKEITTIKASSETNIVETINKAIEMFPSEDVTKHLIILSDAIPTIGKDPKKETLEAVSKAISSKITVSVIGIQLDKEGEEFAKKIVEVGQGRLYVVKDLEQLDKIILEDYYSLQ